VWLPMLAALQRNLASDLPAGDVSG
jgi:hypothetical protein